MIKNPCLQTLYKISIKMLAFKLINQFRSITSISNIKWTAICSFFSLFMLMSISNIDTQYRNSFIGVRVAKGKLTISSKVPQGNSIRDLAITERSNFAVPSSTRSCPAPSGAVAIGATPVLHLPRDARPSVEEEAGEDCERAFKHFRSAVRRE